MEKNQVSKNNMYSKMLVFFTNPKFMAIWASFQVLVDDINLFTKRKGKLDDYIKQQGLSISGVTEDKDADVLSAELLTVKLAKKAKVWAKKAGDKTLQALFTITKSNLGEMAASVSIAKMNEILGALNDNATALLVYNITTTDTGNLTAFITTATTALGTPGAAKANTGVGTEGVASQILLIDDVLKDIDDVLIAEYSDSNADMVKEYKNDRKIDNVGHFATVLAAEITSALTKLALEGIKMTIIELGKMGESNIDGLAEIKKFKAGKYHVKFEGDGFVTQIIIVETKRGKVVKMVVVMVGV